MITILQASDSDAASAVLGLGLGLVMMVFYFGLIFFFLFCFYKIFKKAGVKDPWAAFIPIYGTIVRMEVIKQPWWQLFMYLIPIYGLYLVIVDTNRLSKFFGKDEGYTVGLLFLPILFYPILAFGDAKYNPNALPDLRQK